MALGQCLHAARVGGSIGSNSRALNGTTRACGRQDSGPCSLQLAHRQGPPPPL